jgi:hypothetical protein
MRYAWRTLVAAVVAATAAITVAAFSAARLADAPVRGRPAGPDPLGSLLTIVGVAIGLIAFERLGGSIAADGRSSRAAIVAGAAGGAIAGGIGGTAQAMALADYLGAVLAGYAVPPEFLSIALGAYVVIAAGVGTVVGAGTAYVGWHRRRRRMGQPTG